MVPGFRYHLVTLIAIFLALGVGIAIGSSFVQGPLVEQQTKRLDDLKNQYNSQVLVSQDSLHAYSDLLAALTPRLVQGRLTGLRIAMIQTGDYPDTLRRTRDALEQAGATVTSETVVQPGFAARAKTVASTLLPKLTAFPESLAQDETSLMKVLASSIAKGGPEFVSQLADARLIRQSGDYTVANDWTVLVGGAEDETNTRVDDVDVPLAAALKSYGAKVLEVEPRNATVSYITSLRGSEISTVDNADTDIGRLAVVLALKAERGSYGVKSGSQSGILPVSSIDDLRRHSSL